MSRLASALPLLLVLPSLALAQSLTPEEAVKRMKLPDGFSVRCVAHEPMIRQPVSISFDTRGRMWVLQYLQYPNYEGLKPVKQDQYLRTIWDKIPEPPPKGPKGLDRITILSDPDEHGVFRKSKDFVTGLNIASGFCTGHGGVYVAQPPYLLYYPDKNEDDVPDGDPEVLLTGFGMDDTHSLANSLQWGPDGWLYGAAGSTSNCAIKNPNHPKDPVVEFQQGIWRFHPKTKKFELFSEGGGNTYGLDFDRNGQVIAGTNWGGFAMLHQMQGAYYIKGFAKHGPLHNPHTYGYFDHVPYTGFKGGHVTCGGIVYQADVYPEQYRNQYIAANLLSNDIYWHKMEVVKSSFKASFGGTVLEGNDPWFRPIDCLQGPDGCVYVVDFYDRRAAHLDPVDNWDKTNGRIYRIEYQGGPRYPAFDLRKKTTPELLELLKHPNVWYRREARQLLAERRDESAYETLRKWVKEEKGQLALEALWALYVSGGWDRDLSDALLKHSDEYVRAWAFRFLGEGSTSWRRSPKEDLGLARFVLGEQSPVVLAQIACTAKRFASVESSLLAAFLLANPVSETDPQLPLLIWWALESTFGEKRADGVTVALHPKQMTPLLKLTVERIARRLMAEDMTSGPEVLAVLLDEWAKTDPTPLLRGILQALQSHSVQEVPKPLREPLAKLRKSRSADSTVIEILARMHDPAALEIARQRATKADMPDAQRILAIDLLRQIRDPEVKEPFLTRLSEKRSDAVKVALLAALEGYDDAKIGETVLAAYSGYSPAVKKRALQLLLARPTWGLQLFKALDAGKFPKADVSVDQARTAVGLGDKNLTAIVEKHFGKLAPATAGEKQARISWLNVQIPREKNADAARGKELFTKHCAACHTLHGEGGKAGPDLTTADRKNRGYLIAQIVDPSGYIRPEFVVQNILTTDERKLLGIAKEMGESIELTNYVDNKVVTTTVAKKDIADIRPSAVSLMPEKLLDTLSDPQIADLFAYLMSDPKPVPSPGTAVPGLSKKLKVCLVSGSFEYKSDASLSEFKKYLEANFPVECTLVSAKSDKDKDLPGIENLEKCDVAVFFTRRLMIDGPALDAVKKYVASKKPIVGIRTASHGFQNWLQMDKEVLGGDYKNHYGPGVADIKPIEKQKDHPVLKGVSAFKTNGSLYKNPNVAPDVTVLLQGYMGKEAEPVAWVREKDGRRVFYTSLGHPDDFKEPDFIRLLVNGLAWASKTELKAAK
jgi:putative membrane-bound dehydrogenase-like protein